VLFSILNLSNSTDYYSYPKRAIRKPTGSIWNSTGNGHIILPLDFLKLLLFRRDTFRTVLSMALYFPGYLQVQWKPFRKGLKSFEIAVKYYQFIDDISHFYDNFGKSKDRELT